MDLELEVDPLNVDHFSCTPLVSPRSRGAGPAGEVPRVTPSPCSPQMWACALGHAETALVLHQWDPRALNIPDSLGRLPLTIARSRGHTRLAELLEQLTAPPDDSWTDRWRPEPQGGSPRAGGRVSLRSCDLKVSESLLPSSEGSGARTIAL